MKFVVYQLNGNCLPLFIKDKYKGYEDNSFLSTNPKKKSIFDNFEFDETMLYLSVFWPTYSKPVSTSLDPLEHCMVWRVSTTFLASPGNQLVMLSMKN